MRRRLVKASRCPIGSKLHVLVRTHDPQYYPHRNGESSRGGICRTFGEESLYFFPRVSQPPAARTFFTDSDWLLYVKAMTNPPYARKTFPEVR
jgi:hypothetical protein